MWPRRRTCCARRAAWRRKSRSSSRRARSISRLRTSGRHHGFAASIRSVRMSSARTFSESVVMATGSMSRRAFGGGPGEAGSCALLRRPSRRRSNEHDERVGLIEWSKASAASRCCRRWDRSDDLAPAHAGLGVRKLHVSGIWEARVGRVFADHHLVADDAEARGRHLEILRTHRRRQRGEQPNEKQPGGSHDGRRRKPISPAGPKCRAERRAHGRSPPRR